MAPRCKISLVNYQFNIWLEFGSNTIWLDHQPINAIWNLARSEITGPTCVNQIQIDQLKATKAKQTCLRLPKLPPNKRLRLLSAVVLGLGCLSANSQSLPASLYRGPNRLWNGPTCKTRPTSKSSLFTGLWTLNGPMWLYTEATVAGDDKWAPGKL